MPIRSGAPGEPLKFSSLHGGDFQSRFGPTCSCHAAQYITPGTLLKAFSDTGGLGIGVLLAASAAGLSATQLTVVFGALGVGIGFGLQTVVNNFVSGLILMFERPVKVGDRVETAGRAGIVSRIGIRASMIRTFDGAEVVVPNSDLVSKEVVNWTLSDEERRGEILVGVAYGSEVKKVLGILKNVGDRPPQGAGRAGASGTDDQLRGELSQLPPVRLDRAGVLRRGHE